MSRAFVRTAPALANTPSRRTLLQRIRHRTPTHVDRVSLCCEGVALCGKGRAAKIPHPPPPESHNHHHDRALSQQPEDDMVALLFVLACV